MIHNNGVNTGMDQLTLVPPLTSLDRPVPSGVVMLPRFSLNLRFEKSLAGGVDFREGFGSRQIPSKQSNSSSCDESSSQCGRLSHLGAIDGDSKDVGLNRDIS